MTVQSNIYIRITKRCKRALNPLLHGGKLEIKCRDPTSRGTGTRELAQIDATPEEARQGVHAT